MNNEINHKEIKEINMFGMTKEQIEDMVENEIMCIPNDTRSVKMAMMSMISDMQEMMNGDDLEEARKLGNVVKFIMSKYI